MEWLRFPSHVVAAWPGIPPVQTSSQFHVQSSSTRTGSVAAALKQLKWANITNGVDFIPVPTETSRNWCEQVIGLINNTSRWIDTQRGVTHEPRSTTWLCQRISIGVQWSNALCKMRTVTEWTELLNWMNGRLAWFSVSPQAWGEGFFHRCLWNRLHRPQNVAFYSCIQAFFVPDGIHCLISRPLHIAFTLKLFRFYRFLVCLTL